MAERRIVNVDENPINADWAKQSWDLGIDNLDDLRKFLAATGTSPAHFKQLPVYVLNVEKPGMEWLKDL